MRVWFRKDRGTKGMIFIARQLQEKCQEQNVDLYVTFVDLTKASDSVSREGLLKNYGKDSCLANFITMARQFRDGMLAKGTKWWRVFWSIPCDKWSSARLCTRFNTVQHDVYCHAYRCFSGWWQWYTYRYRFDGKLFNLRRLQAKSKV